jgi:hypothetical protein
MNAKIEAMEEAMKDELFVADLREVMADFRDADAELLAVEYLPLPLGED